MASSGLLSICIPTYNRENYLARTLCSLFEQLNTLSGEVEVIVSNNNSQDNTKHVCQQYMGYQWFHYHENEVNLGPDYNIAKCYDLASSSYVLILGDDDIICPGGVKAIVDLLKQQVDIDLIALGCETMTNEDLRSIRKIDSYTKYVDPIHFTKDIGVMLTFISGMVVKKSKNFDLAKCLNNFDKSFLIQLSWVLAPLKENGLFIKVNSTLIYTEPDNTGGYHLYDVFSINMKKVADGTLGVGSPVTVKLLASSSRFLLGFVLKNNKSTFVKKINFDNLDSAFYEIIQYRFIYRHLYKNPQLLRFVKVAKGIVNKLGLKYS